MLYKWLLKGCLHIYTLVLYIYTQYCMFMQNGGA